MPLVVLDTCLSSLTPEIVVVLVVVIVLWCFGGVGHMSVEPHT